MRTLVATLALIIYATVIAQCEDKQVRKDVRKYDRCIKKGYESTINGCDEAGESKLNKKKIKKCAKIEDRLKDCGYTCVDPTESPTSSPTTIPTSTPTNAPTSTPTTRPTSTPTTRPTNKPTVRILKLTSWQKHGLANNLDGQLDWSAGSNRMMSGAYSSHSNWQEDRRWGFYSSYASGVTCTPMGWSNYVNGNDGALSFSCPERTAAMYAAHSIHSNWHEDRRWKFRCCQLSANVYLQNSAWTGYVNGLDGNLDFQCLKTEVMVGLSSYHANWQEDRRWKFRCARLLTKM